MWKSLHIPNYPIKTELIQRPADVAVSLGQLKERNLSNASQRTFLNDAMHIWNKTSITIKQSVSLYTAKKAIKNIVFTLPI